MASLQQIKRRITSVRNTKQITKAMELVAASKLRRAQEAVQGPREFSRVAREMLTHLRHVSQGAFPLYAKRTLKHRLIIAVASDRPLAGAYNVNITRQLIAEVTKDRAQQVETMVICVGKQVANAAARVRGLQIAAVYQDIPDRPDAKYIRPILNTAIDEFMAKKIDAVDIIFTHYESTVVQQVTMQRILPVGFEEAPTPPEITYAELEPSLDELVTGATTRLLEVQLYQAVLDAIASEHSMRMLAMKNATDNASDLIDDLTLAKNNARQAAITQELAEITGGAEALK